MTKREIVVAIANETGLPQQDVARVVQRTLDHIRAAVVKGVTIELRNFGVFEVKMRRQRIGRNPNAPEKDVIIPARPAVKFKPGKEMREEILKLTPDQIAAAAGEKAAKSRAEGAA